MATTESQFQNTLPQLDQQPRPVTGPANPTVNYSGFVQGRNIFNGPTVTSGAPVSVQSYMPAQIHTPINRPILRMANGSEHLLPSSRPTAANTLSQAQAQTIPMSVPVAALAGHLNPSSHGQMSKKYPSAVAGAFALTSQPSAGFAPSQSDLPQPDIFGPAIFSGNSNEVPGGADGPGIGAQNIPLGKRRQYPLQPLSSNGIGSGVHPSPSGLSSSGQVQSAREETFAVPQSTAVRPVTQHIQRTAAVQQTQSLTERLTVEQSPTYPVNLMELRDVFPAKPIERPSAPISQELHKRNPDPGIMNCTFNAVPQTSNLAKQCKLPFGIHIHPFKDNLNIPVISSSVITRCRSCRSYINPFVSILDHRRWQCNMCFRINDIPDELSYNPTTKQYTDIRRRPELTYASVEFVAPTEYMLRPPQPSVLLFVFDVSFNAVNTGYLQLACQVMKENLDKLPGDSRSMIGFITFNSSIHFYSLKDNQPRMMVVADIEDVYLPVPDGLLVNIKEHKETIHQLLDMLPVAFANERDTQSATGAALLAARKMVSSTGGRVTLFQTCLPSIGPGHLTHRECASMSSDSKDVVNLNPATDFYKKLALECAGEQTAVDILLLSGQYCDLASLSCVSRYSSGCIHYYPDFHHAKNESLKEKFLADFKRYLTRNIGLEAVMRLRCTKGLSIHTFHGNFFVRSTDLLSLPNVNPDHSFSMQISIEEALTDSSMVSFQAALLYTTTKGERRIRVHTLCLPVTTKLSDVYAFADQQAIISSLSQLAVDRTLTSSLGDAREALMNACIDCLKVYRTEVSGQRTSTALLAPYSLRALPLLILALMKNDAFRLGSGVSLDSRVFSLLEFKCLPFHESFLKIYPRVFSVTDLLQKTEWGAAQNLPPILHASAEKLKRHGAYIMDTDKMILILVGRGIADSIVEDLFNLPNFASLPEILSKLPVLESPLNVAVREFLDQLQSAKCLNAAVYVMREDSRGRAIFFNNLIDDRTEASMAYQEFLQHIQRQLNS